jgi:hypothetical protein
MKCRLAEWKKCGLIIGEFYDNRLLFNLDNISLSSQTFGNFSTKSVFDPINTGRTCWVPFSFITSTFSCIDLCIQLHTIRCWVPFSFIISTFSCIDWVYSIAYDTMWGDSISRSTTGLPDGRYIFKPKIPICVSSEGSCNGRCRYTLWLFGLIYGHMMYFMVIWSHLVYISPFWYFVPKKNLATLIHNRRWYH